MTTAMFVDANGKELYRGSEVTFYSSTTKAHMDGVVTRDHATGQMVEVLIDGDPFPVNVPMTQLTKRGEGMPAATEERPSRKEMRKLASKLNINGWEALSTDALWDAICEAQGPASNGKKKSKKSKSKKAKRDREAAEETPVKTKTKKKASTAKTAKSAPKNKKPAKETSEKPAKETAVNGNPFRPGTNLALITDELIKGGKRATIIARLLKKIDLHPWAKKPKDLDLNFEMDKRVLLCAHMLKGKHGFTIKLEGRGPGEGTIKAFPPTGKSAAKSKPAEKTGPKVKAKRTTKKAVAKKKVKKAA